MGSIVRKYQLSLESTLDGDISPQNHEALHGFTLHVWGLGFLKSHSCFVARILQDFAAGGVRTLRGGF